MQIRKGLLEEALPKLPQLEKWLQSARFSKRPGTPPARSLPMISVVIPAHNEELYLHQTLSAVNRQRYPAFETIVVANGCTDKTVEVAQVECDRVLVLPRKGLGAARNLGARVAHGELLLFLDADTILAPEALSAIAEQFTRDCVAGTIKGVPDQPRLGYRVLYFCKNLIHRWSVHQGSAGVILCWKSDFEAVNGFDENLQVRENSELIRRLRRSGRKYRFVSGTEAITSMRRYEYAGPWRTAWLWICIWIESWFRDLRQKSYATIR